MVVIRGAYICTCGAVLAAWLTGARLGGRNMKCNGGYYLLALLYYNYTYNDN